MSPTYKKLFVSSLLVIVLLITFNSFRSVQKPSVDVTDLPADYILVDGYVVSKRINTMWLAPEPITLWGRLTGYVTSDYGAESIIVSKHDNAQYENIFKGLKVNEKVRVYGDRLKESFPGKTSAYAIKVLSDN